MQLISAECQPPSVIVVVRVGCGSEWLSLVQRTALTDKPLVLPQSVFTGVGVAASEAHDLLTLASADLPSVLHQGVSRGVVTAAGDTQMLSPFLLSSFPQGEVRVLAFIIFSIPIPSGCALCPSEPRISIWSQDNSPDIYTVILTFTNHTLIVVVVVHVNYIHVLSVADLGKFSMCHLILRDPDQVISVTFLHDSMTRKQV